MCSERRSIKRETWKRRNGGLSIVVPAPLSERTVKLEIFQTGMKVLDVLSPLERGGKAGLFGGAGVGKTVLIRR